MLSTTFRRSSRSYDSTCLEAAFRKSSRSGSSNGACVEAAHRDHEVLVRDSKQTRNGVHCGPVLRFAPVDWEAFVGNPPVRLR